MDHMDLDGDGILSEKEFELYERKVTAKRKMSYIALWAMVLFTFMLMTPLVPESRVDSLADVFSMFYLTMGGIIATFFGVSAWMGKK